MEGRPMRLTFGKIGWGVAGTLFLMTPLFASTSKQEAKTLSTPTYNWAHAEVASGSLRQIHELSGRLVQDSHFLELHSRRNQLEWRNHAAHLRQIRANVNALGRNLKQLQAIHGTIAPWQQKAVKRITPNAVALATHTAGAIEYLNREQSRTWAPPYTQRVGNMEEHARQIRSALSMFIEYAKTSDHLKGLENLIEFTGA
jgi:hypothetical protein